MNDERIKEMLKKSMEWVKKNKILTILILFFALTLSSCTMESEEVVDNNENETQVEQQEEKYIEEEQQEEYIEEEDNEQNDNLEDKTKQAKQYIENLLVDYFRETTYRVETSNNTVVVAFGVDVTNCTIDKWNELVEQEKEFTVMIQEYFDENYEGVEFMCVISCQGKAYLVVKNGVVYYDYFNDIDKIGIGKDESYSL